MSAVTKCTAPKWNPYAPKGNAQTGVNLGNAQTGVNLGNAQTGVIYATPKLA